MHTNKRMSKINIHNGIIYLSGQTAGSEESNIKEQTEQCLSQIEELIGEAGGDCNCLLSVTIYLKDMSHFDGMNAVWDAWISEKSKPARACVQAAMARTNILVEFSVTATL